jgi:virulence-associated protein VagC
LRIGDRVATSEPLGGVGDEDQDRADRQLAQGVRIPKPLIEQAGLSGEVEITVQDGSLVIKPVAKATRDGWAAAFEEMARLGDDALLM